MERAAATTDPRLKLTTDTTTSRRGRSTDATKQVCSLRARSGSADAEVATRRPNYHCLHGHRVGVHSTQGASGAGPANTPPTLQVDTSWAIGSQLTPTNLLDNTPDESCQTNDYSIVPYEIAWSASDPSGIFDYNLWKTTVAHSAHFIGWTGDWGNESGSSTQTLNDYQGDCGGDSFEEDGFAITAYDNEGNAKYVTAGSRPFVYQENGTAATHWFDVGITYTGTWKQSLCTCASGGRQVSTTAAGATVTSPPTREIGLVMAKGPGRGQADILVDGVRVGTVDTRATTNTNRIIVWTRTLGSGTHTVQIRNLATAGRPRIDFDAILLKPSPRLVDGLDQGLVPYSHRALDVPLVTGVRVWAQIAGDGVATGQVPRFPL